MAAEYADFTDTDLNTLVTYFADDVEIATAATDRHAADRQRVALDRLHGVALEQHARRSEAAAEAYTGEQHPDYRRVDALPKLTQHECEA